MYNLDATIRETQLSPTHGREVNMAALKQGIDELYRCDVRTKLLKIGLSFGLV